MSNNWLTVDSKSAFAEWATEGRMGSSAELLSNSSADGIFWTDERSKELYKAHMYTLVNRFAAIFSAGDTQKHLGRV
jgi:hypothetical protein